MDDFVNGQRQAITADSVYKIMPRIYDHRKTRPEDSPTFKVAY